MILHMEAASKRESISCLNVNDQSNPSFRGSTSLRSSIANGLIENGRKYQVLRDNNLNMPSDERQYDSMEAGHMAYTVIESQQDNPYFRSKLSPEAQHIIDLGTGKGNW